MVKGIVCFWCEKERGMDPMVFVVDDPSLRERCRDHGMGYVPAEPWKYMTGLLDDNNIGPSMVGFLFESSDMIDKAWRCWRGLAIVVVSQIDLDDSNVWKLGYVPFGWLDSRHHFCSLGTMSVVTRP
jgi:hypothetical protein